MNPTISSDLPKSADLSNLSLISEAPMIVETCESMDVENSDHFNGQQTLEERTPVIVARKESTVIINDSTHKTPGFYNASSCKSTIISSNLIPIPKKIRIVAQ